MSCSMGCGVYKGVIYCVHALYYLSVLADILVV